MLRPRSSLLFSLALACPLSLPLLAAVGCGGSSDQGRQRSDNAVSSLKSVQAELAGGQKQVDEMLAALTGLESGQTPLPKAFEKYRSEVAKTEAQAAKIASRAADMRARATEYQTAWKQEISQVTNPELKAAAEKRAATVRGRYDAIADKAQATRAAYQPFISDLKDVQTFLSNDLTPAAVTAAKPVFDKAKASGADLNQKMAALSGELESVASDMSAVPTPPPAPTTPKS